jgi:cyclopropane-fatty-acyl-phospholipid synthase
MFDLMELAEKGKMPDTAVRAAIRKLLRDRLKVEGKATREDRLESLYRFIDMMREGPVAAATDSANEQHYEVPSELFQTFMGPHLKYSCGYWPTPETSLVESEDAMLELTCRRAGLVDGMDILELGCGWGSLSLWMAQHFPNSRITAVSNSRTQKKFIDARRPGNLDVVTADMNDFCTEQKVDRVVSVEMFEHMRNWPELLHRINGWLKPDGRLFVHIFVHRELAYLFNGAGENNWMAEHFFKEGMMPAESLLSMLNDDLLVERHWCVNGRHYEKTLRALPRYSSGDGEFF